MAIDGRPPAPERHPELGRLKISSSRDGGLARAATRRRFDEAALAAAVRELRTRRRRVPVAVARAQQRHVPQPSNHRAESLRAAKPLTVRPRHDADTLTIALCGDLDLATAHMLKRELDDAAHSNAAVIVLDLRKLAFIDSSGLHVIFTAHRRTGPQLFILKGPARVQRAFELSGLEELLTFVDEIPVHTPAKSDISSAPGDTANRSANRSSVTLRTAIARRAQQGALAAAVRELRSHGRLQAIR